MDDVHIIKLRKYLLERNNVPDTYVAMDPDIPGSSKVVMAALFNYFPRRLAREDGSGGPSWVHFSVLKDPAINGVSKTIDDFHWILLTRGVLVKLHADATSLVNTNSFLTLLRNIGNSGPISGWQHLIFSLAVEWLVMHEMGHVACGHTGAMVEGVFETKPSLQDLINRLRTQQPPLPKEQRIAMEYQADQFANDAFTMGAVHQFFRFCDIHQAKQVLEPTEIALGAFLGQALAFQSFVVKESEAERDSDGYPPLRVRLHCAVRGNTDMLQEIIFDKPELSDWCSTLQEVNRVAYETAHGAAKEVGNPIVVRAFQQLFDRDARNNIYDEAISFRHQADRYAPTWQKYRLGWYRE